MSRFGKKADAVCISFTVNGKNIDNGRENPDVTNLTAETFENIFGFESKEDEGYSLNLEVWDVVPVIPEPDTLV